MICGLQSSNPINNSELIITVLFSTVISVILIWIVGLLSLGLAVDGNGAAFLTGLAVAVTGGVISWSLSIIPKRINQAASQAEANELEP